MVKNYGSVPLAEGASVLKTSGASSPAPSPPPSVIHNAHEASSAAAQKIVEQITEHVAAKTDKVLKKLENMASNSNNDNNNNNVDLHCPVQSATQDSPSLSDVAHQFWTYLKTRWFPKDWINFILNLILLVAILYVTYRLWRRFFCMRYVTSHIRKRTNDTPFLHNQANQPFKAQPNIEVNRAYHNYY